MRTIKKIKFQDIFILLHTSFGWLTIPRKKQKIKFARKFACKHLTSMGDIANSLQSLCYCPERDLILGKKAYVCQVCTLYVQTNQKVSEVYEESRKGAEKKIKEKKIELEAFELAELKVENDLDLTIDEFEEEDGEVPLKFEKRKVGKEEIEDSEFDLSTQLSSKTYLLDQRIPQSYFRL